MNVGGGQDLGSVASNDPPDYEKLPDMKFFATMFPTELDTLLGKDFESTALSPVFRI